MKYCNHLILLLLLTLVSISCSEADQNKNNLIGEWRLHKRTVSIGDNELETTYVGNDCLKNKGFIFNSNSEATTIIIDTLCNESRINGNFSVTATALYISAIQLDENENQVKITSKYAVNKVTSTVMELVYIDTQSQLSVLDEYHKK